MSRSMGSSVATFFVWQVASVCCLGTDVGETMYHSAATWHTQVLHKMIVAASHETHTGYAAARSREQGEQTRP